MQLTRLLPALLLVAGAASACISRDVTSHDPDLKTNFVTVVRAGAVDKVDLLFAIDNSSSMGDKQAILRDAIPDLLERLVRPRCLDASGRTVGSYDPKAGCPSGSQPEFRAIRDLHVGIVSSSLGGLGSRACADARRNDNDRGRLIARTKSGDTPVVESDPEGFLAYLPNVPENTGRPRDPALVGSRPFEDPKALVTAFQRLVVGVGENGCGYEAQLESAYRFLVQPDPYADVVSDNGTTALAGIDEKLLAQRRAFLRPDSLVAVVVVTDENESTIDPTAFGGAAWRFLDPDPLPPGTQACKDTPDSPACVSCSVTSAQSDPRCVSEPTLIGDDPNVRFFDPKRRFGFDPRYPLERYVRGFTEDRVPDRTGTKQCVNPLFAARLPSEREDLCNLDRGPRTNRDILFTVIGGVPWQLLTEQPSDLSRANAAPFKEGLSEQDFTMLLGPKTPSRSFDAANPLLRESIVERPGVGIDDAHGREWNTQGRELQYACTFDLPTPKDCAPGDDACDCASTTSSPLCDPDSPRRQLRGKAYPSLSSLAVARGLGDRAVVGSICPRELGDKTSPQYGYRPVMSALVQRISEELVGSCVPPLHPEDEGKVRCLVLEAQPKGASSCDAARGRKPADAEVLAHLDENTSASLAGRTVCTVDQIVMPEGPVSCADDPRPGYCYVAGRDAPKRCGHAVTFSKAGAPPPNSTVFLQCIDAR